MRAGLMPLIVIVTAVIGAGPSRSEEPRLADKTPDGARLIDLYKAARTVADVEAANGKVKDEVLRVQSVASDLARLHAAKMTLCEDVEQSNLEATAAKARSFSATLARIDGELTKSLSAMRQRVAAERSSSTRAKDDVNRLYGRGKRIGQAQSADPGARESDPGRRTEYPHRSGLMPADAHPAAVRRGQHAVE